MGRRQFCAQRVLVARVMAESLSLAPRPQPKPNPKPKSQQYLADAEAYWHGKDFLEEVAAANNMSRSAFEDWFMLPVAGKSLNADLEQPHVVLTQPPLGERPSSAALGEDSKSSPPRKRRQHDAEASQPPPPRKRRNIAREVEHFMQHWLPPAALEITTLEVEDKVGKALSTPGVDFALLYPNATEGRILAHAMHFVDALKDEQHFKIGITQDPAHRWDNPDFGYLHHTESGIQMTNMVVVYLSTDNSATAMLEAALIATCLRRYPKRCLNKARGGENKTSSPLHFTYVVYG